MSESGIRHEDEASTGGFCAECFKKFPPARQAALILAESVMKRLLTSPRNRHPLILAAMFETVAEKGLPGVAGGQNLQSGATG